jgi:UDP-N-acetylmuramoyl-tripeptide--D-alanyl-D-alanine ligase
VIAVVGSNGKTTVKEMIAAILRAHFGEGEVHATRGNFNNAIGLPLTLLALRVVHRAAVVELGMNHPGETAELAAIVQPTIALINNAQREHQEFMLNTTMVAEEHATLLCALRDGGIAVLNADDPHLDLWRGVARDERRTVIDFALDHPAAVTAHAVAGEGGAAIDLVTAAGTVRVQLPIPGRHNALNAAAAAAAAVAAGIPLDAVRRGLEAFRPVAGRLVTRRAPGGAVVIDDTYNANPDSVRAAIDVLAGVRGPRWLVLGDMGEVGAQGAAYHHEVGEYARERGIDRLFAAGAMTAATAAAFGARASHFTSVEDLLRELPLTETAGVTVLVKGSRFMRMERVVALLMGDAPGGGTH